MSINSLAEWDGVRRERFEIVRTRCTVCKHECYCAIPLDTPRNAIYANDIACANIEDEESGYCGFELLIIGARGIAHRVLPVNAPRYDVQLAPPLPPAPIDPSDHRHFRRGERT